jgi:hypothetical protein
LSKWLQTEPPVENTQLCKKREGGRDSEPHGKLIERRAVGYLEDGDDTFLLNVGSHKTYTEPHRRKLHFS